VSPTLHASAVVRNYAVATGTTPLVVSSRPCRIYSIHSTAGYGEVSKVYNNNAASGEVIEICASYYYPGEGAYGTSPSIDLTVQGIRFENGLTLVGGGNAGEIVVVGYVEE